MNMQSSAFSMSTIPQVTRMTGCIAAVALLWACSATAAERLLGEPAPDFALRALITETDGEAQAGRAVRLSEHLGEVVILNFWAIWCGACRQQMPALEEIHQRYRRAGLILYGVNLDETPAVAGEMATTLQVSYRMLVDAAKAAAQAYRIETLPTTVIIDRSGVVRRVTEGYKLGHEERYAQQLRELLNE